MTFSLITFQAVSAIALLCRNLTAPLCSMYEQMQSLTKWQSTFTTLHPTSDDIVSLAMMVRGDLFLPGTVGYEFQLKRMHCAAFHSRTPAFFVMCHDEGDIQEVLKFINKFKMPISVRSGGHSACGSSCRDGTVVIDLSKMCKVEYNNETTNVTFQPGATLSDLNVALLRLGRSTPIGVISATGAGGLVLHGGVGWLMHKYGLSVDNVLEVTMILADGTVKTLNHDSEGDDRELFFGVRGAASVLGLVTSITMKTYPMEIMTAGLWLMLDDKNYTKTRELCKLARDIVKEEEKDGNERTLVGGVYMVNVPPDDLIPEELHHKPATMCILGAWGVDEKAAEMVQKFIDRDIIFGQAPAPMPFNVFNQICTGMFLKFPLFNNYFNGGFVGVDGASDEILDKYMDKWATHEPWLNGSFVGFEFYAGKRGAEHGAKLNSNSDHCANKLRNAVFTLLNFIYFPNEEGLYPKAKAASLELEAIYEDAKVSSYVNYANSLVNPKRETELSFSNIERLRAIKEKVDPDNIFNRSVIPVNDKM